MKKKILVSFILIVSLIFSFSNSIYASYDYQVGLVLGKPIYINGTNAMNNLTDGNLSTNYRFPSGRLGYIYFDEPMTIKSMFQSQSTNSNKITYSYFDEDNKLIYTNKVGQEGDYYYELDYTVSNVKTIKIHNENSTSWWGKAIDFYGYKTSIFDEVVIKKVTAYHNKVYLNWQNPFSIDLKKIKIYKGTEYIGEVLAPLDYYYVNNLIPNTEYKFILRSYYDPPGDESVGVEVYTTTSPVPQPKNIDVKVLNYHSAEIRFDKPDIADLKKIAIFLKDEEIKEENIIAETKGSYIKLENLQYNQLHEYNIISITEGGYNSFPIEFSFNTPQAPPVEEITELVAVPKHNRVDLSWQIPQHNPNFYHVKIYRKKLNKNTSFIENMLIKSVYADTEYEPLFETNGTYFNDLTVKPSTSYEYKLTTNTKLGDESEGVTVQVTTLADKPILDGLDEDIDENGDYIFTWTSPMTGKIRIEIGGKEYVTVDASLGKITIPKEDMKYKFGNPDVRLIAISESGEESEPKNPYKLIRTGFPISVMDVIEGGMELIGLVAAFVILVFAIIFAPRIIRLIKNSLSKNKGRVRK